MVARSMSLGNRLSLALCAALLLGLSLATNAGAETTPATPGLTQFIKLKTSTREVAVTLGCSGASTQTCSGMLIINDARSLSKQKVIGVTTSKQESKPLKLGESTFSLAGGSTVTFTVKLNSTGISLLHRVHSLPTVVLGSEAMPKNEVFLFLFHAALLTEPKHKQHHHLRKRH